MQLDGRDRALATELVYGTLRYHRWLVSRLAKHAPRGVDKLDPRVLSTLVVAAYQLLVLTRVPPFAAVNEAVSAVRALRGDRMAAFANAVLRKIGREPRPEAGELAEAAFDSADPALAAALVRALGGEAAKLLVFGGDGPPPLGIRVEREEERATWLARFTEAKPNATFEVGRISPLAVLARGAGRIVELPGHASGAWTPQEEGSQLVSLALGAREGDTVLDACAGRGNKTGLLARAVGASGAVDAADVHPSKLTRLEGELARIGVAARRTFAVDWSAGAGGVVGAYDRVLVDAPCSGTGTMRRRPELLLRRAAGDLPSLAELQRAILRRVASLVAPKGRLVYAVCSVLVEEAEEVVAIAPELGLAPAPFDGASARALASERSTLRLLPQEHGTDGYFLASFVKT